MAKKLVKKEISNNVLAVLVLIAVIFSVASVMMQWSAKQAASTETVEVFSGPDTTKGTVSVTVVDESATENVTEGGNENGG